MERLLETCENKIQYQENLNLEMRESLDEVVNTKNSLCDYIITKYHQMETKHKEFKEKLEMTSIENVHFKSVTKYLKRAIHKLIGRDDVEKRLINDNCSNDNVLLLEVSHCACTELCYGDGEGGKDHELL